MTDTSKPIKTYKMQTLSLSVWENETEEGKMYSFTFQKAYKDNKEEWQYTQNLHVNDLLKLRILLAEAARDYAVKTQ